MDLQTVMLQEARKAYPSHEEVDQWAEQLLRQSETVAIHAEFVDYCPITVPFGNSPNTLVNKYVKFTASDNRQTFYGYWQPAIRTPAPLLINLPGYGSSISMHPQLADQGFHILHISPLGYAEPNQIHPEMQLPDGNWPVLDRTARGLKGGYADWLSDCLLAIRWHYSSRVCFHRCPYSEQVKVAAAPCCLPQFSAEKSDVFVPIFPF